MDTQNNRNTQSIAETLNNLAGPIIFFTVLFAFLLITLSLVYTDYHETKLAMKNGYSQVLIHNQKLWVKDIKDIKDIKKGNINGKTK